MDRTYALSLFLMASGVLLVSHHLLFWQRPFDLVDKLHHEFFEAIFFTAGLTLLIGKHSSKKMGIP